MQKCLPMLYFLISVALHCMNYYKPKIKNQNKILLSSNNSLTWKRLWFSFYNTKFYLPFWTTKRSRDCITISKNWLFLEDNPRIWIKIILCFINFFKCNNILTEIISLWLQIEGVLKFKKIQYNAIE